MSAAKLVLALLATDPVRSLALEAGKALIADALRRNAASALQGGPCPHCGRSSNGRGVNNRCTAELRLPGRARIAVPGLAGNPRRVAPVEAALLGVRGVFRTEANHLTGRVLVLFDPAVVDLSAICRALDDGDAGRDLRTVDLELVGAGR